MYNVGEQVKRKHNKKKKKESRCHAPPEQASVEGRADGKRIASRVHFFFCVDIDFRWWVTNTTTYEPFKPISVTHIFTRNVNSVSFYFRAGMFRFQQIIF